MFADKQEDASLSSLAVMPQHKTLVCKPTGDAPVQGSMHSYGNEDRLRTDEAPHTAIIVATEHCPHTAPSNLQYVFVCQIAMAVLNTTGRLCLELRISSN